MIIMIPPVLQELHWLPEGQRIDFKILLVTFNPINGIAPPYAPINAKPKGGGGGVWHRVGILTFSKQIIKISTPRQKIIVKISRNKWFTSLLLFEMERSNA